MQGWLYSYSMEQMEKIIQYGKETWRKSPVSNTAKIRIHTSKYQVYVYWHVTPLAVNFHQSMWKQIYNTIIFNK